MRLSPCLVLLALGCAAPARQQAPAPVAAAPSAKPARDPASTVYRFEGVEVFGSRRYPAAELLALIGMPAPGTEVDLKDEAFWKELQESKARLQAKYAFAHCRYNLVAFPPTGLARITVDLVDAEDAWRLDFLPEPTATLEDPAGLIAAWQAYDAQKWALRNEVLRSLGELQHRQPQQLLPLEPILAALWYPSTNDRNKAGWALVRIVEATGTAHRRVILEKSGEMLAMMTGLKTETDSKPAVEVLQRLSGKKLGADEAAWRAWLATAQ